MEWLAHPGTVLAKLGVYLMVRGYEVNSSQRELEYPLFAQVLLKQVLKKGSEKANIIAEENIKNIRDIVGLI